MERGGSDNGRYGRAGADVPESGLVPGPKRFLPAVGTPAYHLMLAGVAMFVLGPLGGVSAAFMNFSIGFFIGGQVLAGILGSTITLHYGPEGKHGANYIQTMAASVAGMSGMAVLIQSMAWLGLPEPPAWKLVLYFMSIGMLGVGVGMLYTPLLVDRMQLAYPSGFAVANILRALTDRELLRRSVTKLGGGMLAGYVCGLAALKAAVVQATHLSAATFGAGMIVGARIAVPGLVVAVLGQLIKPYLVQIGWLGPGEPFRKIGFIIALGTILGAAIVDIGLIGLEALRRYRARVAAPPAEDWKRVNMAQLLAWVVFWAAAVVVVGHVALGQPVFFQIVAVALVFVFVLVNGISLGISDSNPISSAFVLTVFILAALGLNDPSVGLFSAAVLLIACCVGGDMQQDRSTGWRLGTNRVNQFRYQALGIVMGAVLCVLLARLFMNAYSVLAVDLFSNPNAPGAEKWQSAMTYKIVGALRGLTERQPHVMTALKLGIALGLVVELCRKLIKRNGRYRVWAEGTVTGRRADFVLDTIVLPSPYAASFGGFVDLPVTVWWSAGGIVGSVYDVWAARWRGATARAVPTELPPDMSAVSLVGGGLIAGDSLAALSVGIYGLLTTVL
ncbi:MAG: OPT/YSL family transporter [Verrucomicrobiae bacterium]|nr:OPT/YSL family transporter [Verrucomicrobiae bacterium]